MTVMQSHSRYTSAKARKQPVTSAGTDDPKKEIVALTSASTDSTMDLYWRSTRLDPKSEEYFRFHHQWWEAYLQWHPEAR